MEATPETPSYVIGISENKITRIPLVKAVEMVRYRWFSKESRLRTAVD